MVLLQHFYYCYRYRSVIAVALAAFIFILTVISLLLLSSYETYAKPKESYSTNQTFHPFVYETLTTTTSMPSTTLSTTSPTTSSRPRRKFQNLTAECQAEKAREWPALELFMTVAADLHSPLRFKNVFLPSLALFWPRNHQASFLAITDNDLDSVDPKTELMINDMALAARQMASVDMRFAFAPPTPFSVAARLGWHKSQWLKFWADNFTHTKYVGFVDTDTVFVGRVTYDDLFRNNKPIVRPIYGKPKVSDTYYWSQVPATTFRFTGFKEPFNCMSYFPIIVKVSHLKFMREAIRNRTFGSSANDRTFDEAFGQMALNDNESEFNIMCAFMWNVFRDDYHWIINESQIGWKGAIEGQVGSLEEAGISKQLLLPSPLIATHFFHEMDGNLTVDVIRRMGVCYGTADDDEQKPEYCCLYGKRTATVNAMEFRFETDDFSNRTGAMEAHLERVARLDRCPFEWPSDQLEKLKISGNFSCATK